MPERRRETRLLCAELVEILWHDGADQARDGVANLEDISAIGACLLTEHHIPEGTQMAILHGDIRLEGVVRYCLKNEIGHFVGIEFPPDSRWSQDEFEPEHLLDPRQFETS